MTADTEEGKGSGREPWYWERLGFDAVGMPVHLPMGVTMEGEGPEDDDVAHHYVCWCNDVDCPLTVALSLAWTAGWRQS